MVTFRCNDAEEHIPLKHKRNKTENTQ